LKNETGFVPEKFLDRKLYFYLKLVIAAC